MDLNPARKEVIKMAERNEKETAEKKETKDIYVEKEPEIARLKKIVNTIRRLSLFPGILLVPILYFTFYAWLDAPLIWRFFRLLVVFLPIIVWYFTYAIKVDYDWERLVIFRFGEYQKTKKPGLRFVFKPFERQIFVKMWENATDLDPQEVLVLEEVKQKDGKTEKVPVDVKVNAIFYYKVDDREVSEIREGRLKGLDKKLKRLEEKKEKLEEGSEELRGLKERIENLEEKKEKLEEEKKRAEKTGKENKFDDPAYKSVTKVKDVDKAILRLVETFLRAISAKYNIERLMREREDISNELKSIVEEEAEDWGVIITKGEFQYVIPPELILKALRGIVIADKERTAVIIKSEGEAKAIEKVSEGEAKAVENVYVSIKANDSGEFQITNLKTLQEMSKNPAALIVPAGGLDVLSAVAASAGKAFKKGSLPESKNA